MSKGAFGLIGVCAILWYFVAGAGSYGRTPYGTAAAFAGTLSLERDACAARMERLFPDVVGAPSRCGGALAEAFQRAHRTYVVEESEFAATAVCLYGAT